MSSDSPVGETQLTRKLTTLELTIFSRKFETNKWTTDELGHGQYRRWGNYLLVNFKDRQTLQ